MKNLRDLIYDRSWTSCNNKILDYNWSLKINKWRDELYLNVLGKLKSDIGQGIRKI